MLFTVLPTLDHPDVVLRPIEATDLDHWAAYLMDPRVYEHTSWNLQSAAQLQPHVWQTQVHAADSPLRLAIACRQSNALIGSIGFHTVSGMNRSAELAYDLATSHWGRGIAGVAAQALTQWAHVAARVRRVQATVLESNARSVKVLERAGFCREGLLRSYRQVRDHPGNFWMYSHVATDDPAN